MGFGRDTTVTQPTIDFHGLLRAILTCVTAGPGLGFNRAVLFLAEEDAAELVAVMAVGPATPEEASMTWARLAGETGGLDALLRQQPDEPPSRLQTLLEGLRFSTAPACTANPLLEAYRTQRVVSIANPATLAEIPPRLREVFGGTEVVCVPLVAKDRTVGLIIADNAFSREPIGAARIQLLQLLALVAGLALDNARIYRQVERQALHLQATLDQLRSTQEQLIHNERLAAVGAVVARVSHEIRNPLATIGGFARSLRAHPEDIERVTRNADIIVDEVEKLEVLLKEMLDFTSPRPPTLELTDVNAIVSRLATVHRDQLAASDVVLELDLAPDLQSVLCDRSQLQRVLLNLWQNALQSMQDSPRPGSMRLAVRTWQESEVVKIAFADSGPGIAREVLQQIFTPFFTTKRRGTGLGLAVVKKIIDDHHGDIHVRTEPMVGTTFTITLPIAR
jgi:signal transduction histidine kinase